MENHFIICGIAAGNAVKVYSQSTVTTVLIYIEKMKDIIVVLIRAIGRLNLLCIDLAKISVLLYVFINLFFMTRTTRDYFVIYCSVRLLACRTDVLKKKSAFYLNINKKKNNNIYILFILIINIYNIIFHTHLLHLNA